ncbi:ganglioside-induced differentiation-associated protein 1-like 1 isoform 2-T2 [Amazona ochrocephala]|uniref:ganglioside-induced differentiation-associated protein 1-like 1 isoform X3 n=1 Tax=Pygoscelis adeliae TaxID=9238 RepID=UPI0003834DF3|nr:PREDICTED: ganglioside-induced differentiation-associated protein 1-like 1 isoform X3 [Pygoscelis adeliae]XP_009953844.1 PREDICTED: ganglioside-induced differentiation-associated protein 1-like 1 isoform X3 [Leptosomus discolor]XP_050763412.1 ganglioside-induced differentiation-associated protein 1-like 1 isoform X5 [Gymnogyps californianus]
MATPNNVTPTNCSWWPISALENDAGKSTEGEENQDPTDPALKSQDRLVLYHWTQSFSSQKVRLVIAEKGLPCEERDVSMPLMEHKEPWFMRLNLGEEVPVIIHRDNIISDYNQIIDYMEKNFTGGHLANASTELMKLDHEEEPQLSEPYLSKQKKLMAKILEHDNVNYLKKILGELGMVLDQIEAELEKRKLEYQGQKCELWLCGCVFTLADVLLGATLHRLKFLGLSKKYWEDGSRPNLQSFFDRIQKRFAFRKVLGDIHTTLLSAVVPNAFRLVKRKPPSFFGASFLMGSLGGMGYFAYWYLKKKYI